jgi:hypothetical protein
MGVDVRDWTARRRLAEAWAGVAVAQAHSLDPTRLDLEELHPVEFAEAVHTWSQAHPRQPNPLLPRAFDVRSASGWAAYTLARRESLEAAAPACAGCGERLFLEEFPIDPANSERLLGRCRRCVAREKAAADV